MSARDETAGLLDIRQPVLDAIERYGEVCEATDYTARDAQIAWNDTVAALTAALVAARAERAGAIITAILGVLPPTTDAMDLTTPTGVATAVQRALAAAEARGVARALALAESAQQVAVEAYAKHRTDFRRGLCEASGTIAAGLRQLAAASVTTPPATGATEGASDA